MSTNNENKEPGRAGRIGFDIFMVIFYIAVGFLCIFKFGSFDIINSTVSYIVGGLLIVYGIFRGYRLYLTTRK